MICRARFWLAASVVLAGAAAMAQEPVAQEPGAEASDEAPAKREAAETLPAIESLSDVEVARMLASDDYARRQRLHHALLLRNDFAQRVAGYLRAADTPEAQQRLIALGRHHFLRAFREQNMQAGGRAAVGVSHLLAEPRTMPGQENYAVHVTRTVPGFPGHAHLRVDDMILAVNDQPIPPHADRNTFGAMVQQFQAGDQVTFEVLRDGKMIDVTLTLASSQALRSMFPYPGDRLQLLEMIDQRWQRRLRDLTQHLDKPTRLTPQR